MAIHMVRYFDKSHVDFVDDRDIDILEHSGEGYYTEEVTQCRMCGKNTKKLEIVGSLPRCGSCVKEYQKMSNRAYELQTAPWDFYDNNFED